MKKFFLGCLALASLMLMSCLPDNGGYSYTTSFGRIVTIDHSSSPIRFICDCTGEVYEPENVKSDEELPMNLHAGRHCGVHIQFRLCCQQILPDPARNS